VKSRAWKWLACESARHGARNSLGVLVWLSITFRAFAGGAETRDQISTFAGTGIAGYSGDNKPAVSAQLANPYGIVRGPDGSLYVCEVDNHVIRRVARDRTITTQAGTGERGYSGDGGPALRARLNEPYEVRFDTRGNMIFVEMKNHLIRRVDARTQIISTIAGTGQPGFSGDGARRPRLN